MENLDKKLIKIYNQGFEDYLDENKPKRTFNDIDEKKAYELGNRHALGCDDVSSVTFMKEKDLLKAIKGL